MRKAFLGILVTGCLVLTSGCATQFNFANYKKVDEGMTKAEVNEILGKPIPSSDPSMLIYQSQELKMFKNEAYIILDAEGNVVDKEWAGDIPAGEGEVIQ